MIEEIKLLLGDAAANFTDAQIGLCYKMALAEIQGYCNRELDYELEMVAYSIAVLKLNRLGSEGLTAQGYSGVSESFLDGYPAEIQNILKRKRKMRVL